MNQLTIDEVYELFRDYDSIENKSKVVKDVGLGYLVMNQKAYSLSGGERQRLKIAKELSKKTKRRTLYILDEPTVGQHLEDVARLIGVLQNIVDDGHTVIIIEHHPHVLSSCDWLIELGPGSGPEGGHIIANGTPESIAKGETPTASYIKEILEGTI